MVGSKSSIVYLSITYVDTGQTPPLTNPVVLVLVES